MDPITATALIVGVAAGGAQTAASISGQRAQAHAQRKAVRQQNAAITQQQKQISAQETVERQKAFDRSHQIRSRIRVAAGESGLGTGGSVDAMLRQADYDEAQNADILSDNAANQRAYLDSTRARYHRPNQILQGIVAGLGGLSTGLSIGSSVMSAGSAMKSAPGVAGAGSPSTFNSNLNLSTSNGTLPQSSRSSLMSGGLTF